MREDLLFAIKWYQELRGNDCPNDLGSYDEMEQRLLDADRLIQLLARELVLLIRQEKSSHVG